MINKTDVNFLTKILMGQEFKNTGVVANNSNENSTSPSKTLDEAKTKKLFPPEENKKDTNTTEEQFSQIEKEILLVDVSGGDDSFGKLIQIELKLTKMYSSLKTPQEIADSTALMGLCVLKIALIYLQKDDSENALKSIKSASSHFYSALQEDSKNFRALYYYSMLFRVAGLGDEGKYFAEKCYEYHPAKFNAFRNLYLYDINTEKLGSYDFTLKYIAEIEKFIEKNKSNADINAYKELLQKYLEVINKTTDKAKKAEYIKKAYEHGGKMMGLVTSNDQKPQDQEAIQLFLLVFEAYKQVEYEKSIKKQ